MLKGKSPSSFLCIKPYIMFLFKDLSYLSEEKRHMKPHAVIRANLNTPDIVIWDKENLQEDWNGLLELVEDSSSPYYIDDNYLLHRLLGCINLALQTETKDPTFCPIIFDSWSCWNATPPNTTQLTGCPGFANFGFHSDKVAKKECTADGTWWIHPLTNR